MLFFSAIRLDHDEAPSVYHFLAGCWRQTKGGQIPENDFKLCSHVDAPDILIASASFHIECYANLYLLQQIDDTVGVMRENITKVSQRGERLDSLQDKTDNLAVSAQGFRRGANRVRKQMWWKGMHNLWESPNYGT